VRPDHIFYWTKDVLYLLHVPVHPHKAEAIGYRTCHTTSLLNQQAVMCSHHEFVMCDMFYIQPIRGDDWIHEVKISVNVNVRLI
jgi:hypothetical protein